MPVSFVIMITHFVSFVKALEENFFFYPNPLTFLSLCGTITAGFIPRRTPIWWRLLLFPFFGRKETLLLLLSLLYTKGVVLMSCLHTHRAYDCDIRRRHFDACDFHHCGQRRLRRQTPQISKKEITASSHNKAVIS